MIVLLDNFYNFVTHHATLSARIVVKLTSYVQYNELLIVYYSLNSEHVASYS